MKPTLLNPFKSIVSVLCIAFSLNACSQSQPDYSGTTSIRMYRNSDADIITLKVPKGHLDHYVLSGPPVPGAKEETAEVKHQMYFTAEASTLKPRSTENNQAFVYPNSLTEEFSFNISVWNKRSERERNGYLQDNYASRIRTFTFSCTTPPAPKTRFGLDWYAGDISNCPKQLAGAPKDMLIERDARGEVKTLLFCTSDEVPELADQGKSAPMADYNPKCEHKYYFKQLNASVTLRYSRFYVKDWRLLEQRINALLLSFVQTSSNP